MVQQKSILFALQKIKSGYFIEHMKIWHWIWITVTVWPKNASFFLLLEHLRRRKKRRKKKHWKLFFYSLKIHAALANHQMHTCSIPWCLCKTINLLACLLVYSIKWTDDKINPNKMQVDYFNCPLVLSHRYHQLWVMNHMHTEYHPINYCHTKSKISIKSAAFMKWDQRDSKFVRHL